MPEYIHKQLQQCAPLRQTGIQVGQSSNALHNTLRRIVAVLLVCTLAACSASTATQTTNSHIPDATTACATCPDSISTALPLDNDSSRGEEQINLAKEPNGTPHPNTNTTAAQSDLSKTPQTKNEVSTVAASQPPVRTPAKPVLPARVNQYTVKDGENLYIIAQHPSVYEDGMLWPLIYRANRDQIKNPRQIYPGQTLSVPRDISESDIEQARSKAKESQIFSTSEQK
ncbi:MAG: LysM peptidoglycan-binding domain-containing protein [Desulfuromonadaceae bacterium]|nr:LysM peptidoglycan-binding domain-containing protein [Desulfuromonadaceae bacterium]